MALLMRSLAHRLSLIRPANVITAPADVIAGWAIAGGVGAAGWVSLAMLAGASACLYAGGVALNDVCDADVDARERPERPIPSGAITRTHAALIAGALLFFGVALAFLSSVVPIAASRLVPEPVNGQQTVGWTNLIPGAVALALVALIVFYDVRLKRSAVFGAPAMGACRGLNLLLGVSVSVAALGAWWPAALGHAVFIAGVTYLARSEAGDADETKRRTGAIIAAAALGIVSGAWAVTTFITDEINVSRMMIGLALFVALTGVGFIRAARNPSEATVRRAVAGGVLGLTLLDAAIAAGFAGWAYGVGVAAFWVIAWSLGRRFAVT